jgi:hypothetical protein
LIKAVYRLGALGLSVADFCLRKNVLDGNLYHLSD